MKKRRKPFTTIANGSERSDWPERPPATVPRSKDAEAPDDCRTGACLRPALLRGPDRSHDQAIGRHPGAIPAFHRHAANGAFETLNFPCRSQGFGAAINRSTFARPVLRRHLFSSRGEDCSCRLAHMISISVSTWRSRKERPPGKVVPHPF